MDKCKFCLEEKSSLQISHIIPKFVYNWMKKTATTGRMRDGRNVNQPAQDGYKTRLLCSSCENEFSAYESYFANFVFMPLTKSDGFISHKEINWQKFNMFILSLLWRATYIMANTKETNKEYYESEIEEFNKCADAIKKAFKHKENLPFKTFFVPLNKHSYQSGVIDIEDYVYFERSIAINLLVDDKNNQASTLYIKLPYILIVCELLNFKRNNWQGLELNKEENFNSPDSKVPNHVESYLKYNCTSCYEMASEIPDSQVDKIMKMASKKTSLENGTATAILKNRNRKKYSS